MLARTEARGDTHSFMATADGSVDDQWIAAWKSRRQFGSSRSNGRNFQVCEVEAYDAGHQWVIRVIEEGRVIRNVHTCRVIKRAVIPGRPSAIDSARRARPGKAQGALDYRTTAIHIGSQIIAQRRGIKKWAIAERHHDVVLLELSQGGSSLRRIEQIHRGNI
jgi:hypothetical protein